MARLVIVTLEEQEAKVAIEVLRAVSEGIVSGGDKARIATMRAALAKLEKQYNRLKNHAHKT